MNSSKYLNELSKSIHSNNINVGWWDGEQCIFEKLQLVSTEVAEATEGARKGLKDTHLTQHPMEVVEFADALIRGLDVGGKLGLVYSEMNLEMPFIHKNRSVGSNHLGINVTIIDLAKAIFIGKDVEVLNHFYSGMITAIILCTQARGWSFNKLMQIVNEKVEFNSRRLDFTLEERNKEHGKKF